MDDDVREDIERRDRELRGWMLKGTRPRRTISLAMALHQMLLPYPREDFIEAWTTLHEFAWDHYDIVDAAKAIFDAEEVPDDARIVGRRLAFGGGWESINSIDPGGAGGGEAGPGGIPPF